MTPRAYYNEVDPYAVQWIRNLIAAGLITDGEVDPRSILDVRPGDLAGFTRCHFFAGIGVWDYALNVAGWPSDRPVWTGSCPCQPFSAAGGRSGFADERHLWPALFHLIRECRPAKVLGEQVASKDGLVWLDLVQADLEGEGYAVGAADLCAPGERLDGEGIIEDEWLQRAILDCPDPILADQLRDYACWARGEISIGAPNIRQRLWFVAHANGRHARSEREQRGREYRQQPEDRMALVLADPAHVGRGKSRPNAGRLIARDRSQGRPTGSLSGGAACFLGNTQIVGRDGGSRSDPSGHREASVRCPDAGAASFLDLSAGFGRARIGDQPEHGKSGQAGAGAGFWSGANWLACRDGKARPVEPGSFPLVDGASFRLGSGSAFEGRSRAGMLKGYGNAINAQRARGFIQAVMEAQP